MDFEHEGRRYVVSWKHVDESDTTSNRPKEAPGYVQRFMEGFAILSAYQREKLGLPKNLTRKTPALYDGLSICRIRTLKEFALDVTPAERWQTVSEGYSFKRLDQPEPFNRREGRRHSFARAIMFFPYEVRVMAWNKFNLIWPPVGTEASYWERRAARLRQELLAAEQENLRLIKKIKEVETTE